MFALPANPNKMLILGVLLTLLLVVTFFYAAKQWHEDWQLAHEALISQATQPATNHESAVIAALPNLHLFGQALSGQVPTSHLQFRVTGIVKVNSEQKLALSKVYISIAGQDAHIYQIGDDLPYGVKVYDITSDTVILQNNGQLEKLPLLREPLVFKAKMDEENLS